MLDYIPAAALCIVTLPWHFRTATGQKQNATVRMVRHDLARVPRQPSDPTMLRLRCVRQRGYGVSRASICLPAPLGASLATDTEDHRRRPELRIPKCKTFCKVSLKLER